MNAVLLPIGIFVILGLVAGILLAVASKLFAVHEDETVQNVRELLPGINCGVCGFSGCDEYAKQVAENGERPNLCVPGGEDVARKVSEMMGVAFDGVARKVALVNCGGHYDATFDKYDYKGVLSCAASSLFYGGRASCRYGCLGFGDCVEVCAYDAIRIENGLAVVDKEKCTGCLMCTKKCPKGLITSEVSTAAVVVACTSKDVGKVTRQTCKNGCIGCKRCEKECEYGAIKIEDNLAAIDYTLCTNCAKCVEVCPMGSIRLFN